MELKKEYINKDIYLCLESTDDYDYFQLAKHVHRAHFCPEGYFYDPYTKTYSQKYAEDYTLYLDENGNKLDPPIYSEAVWKAEKDV